MASGLFDTNGPRAEAAISSEARAESGRMSSANTGARSAIARTSAPKLPNLPRARPPAHADAAVGLFGERVSTPMLGKAALDRPEHARATTRTDAFDGSRDEWRVQLERVHGLGILTASIVHEVSQPLFGITTNASACLRMLSADPPNVEGARETARRTLRDVNRAAEVITRLRALFTERGHPAGTVDLNKAVLEVLATSRSQLRKARVGVSHSLADRLPVVAGDRIQLEQVVQNLIRNAVEAMASVDGKRARTLTITTRCVQNGNALLSVHDVGVGIADQHSNDVFKPFYSTKPEGMGIGLCISRAIVEHHGGRLWVTANDGPGVTFWLSLPRARQRHDSGFLPAAMETIAVASLPSLASRP